MSVELLSLYRKLDRDSIDTKLAIQCSPVIAGVKISNLINVKIDYLKSIYNIFVNTPIKVFVLCRQKDIASILLYREEDLEKYVFSKDVRALLRKLGYNKLNVRFLLDDVRKKYSLYAKGRGDFPHELGIILGYPVEDVYGFIKNQGKNYKMSGYWKVYGDEEKARNLFAKFDDVVSKAIRLLAQQKSLLELLN